MEATKPYYPVLEAEIARNGIVKKELAMKLGMTERHFMSKLAGKTDFWVDGSTYHSVGVSDRSIIGIVVSR